MIFCYSATHKSEAYAKLLGEILNRPVYMLECAIDPSHKFSFFISAILLKSQSIIKNMPKNIDGDDIYIVGPIWAGNIAEPLKYFLKNATIEQRPVNMLLTAAVSHYKYPITVEKTLSKFNLTPGEIHVFATPHDGIDKEIAESHIRELFNV